MTTAARNACESIRERVFETTDPDEMLEFYSEAKARGFSDDDAEAIDEYLTVRIMTARGAI